MSDSAHKLFTNKKLFIERMDHMNNTYYLENHPVCDPKAEIKGKCYRITVDIVLFRLEYSPDGDKTGLHRRC